MCEQTCSLQFCRWRSEKKLSPRYRCRLCLSMGTTFILLPSYYVLFPYRYVRHTFRKLCFSDNLALIQGNRSLEQANVRFSPQQRLKKHCDFVNVTALQYVHRTWSLNHNFRGSFMILKRQSLFAAGLHIWEQHFMG